MPQSCNKHIFFALKDIGTNDIYHLQNLATNVHLGLNQKDMEYYFKKSFNNVDFDDMVKRTTTALKTEGFGVLTEIDMKATLKQKLDVDFHNYKILGACNPPFAYKALLAEDKIGTMLPCNVIIQEKEKGNIEVAAVDPNASMMAVGNKDLAEIATEVTQKLKNVIALL